VSRAAAQLFCCRIMLKYDLNWYPAPALAVESKLHLRVLCPTSLLCALCPAVLLLLPIVLQSMAQLSS
jgi:hypothetical protein